jgi:hypothetical protein
VEGIERGVLDLNVFLRRCLEAMESPRQGQGRVLDYFIDDPDDASGGFDVESDRAQLVPIRGGSVSTRARATIPDRSG